MRVLVAAPDAYTREALVRAAGGDAVATGLDYLPNAMRSIQPDVLVIDAGGDAQATCQAVERARGAAEYAVPVVLMVSANSVWLRGAVPPSLPPCVVLPRMTPPPTLGAAVARLAGVEPLPEVGSGVTWVRDRRELAGPEGAVRLTRSECAIFDAVFEARGAVVPSERIASALWGRPMADTLSKAAIRSHVYTLRKKLRRVGVEPDSLVALSGAGYRLTL